MAAPFRQPWEEASYSSTTENPQMSPSSGTVTKPHGCFLWIQLVRTQSQGSPLTPKERDSSGQSKQTKELGTEITHHRGWRKCNVAYRCLQLIHCSCALQDILGLQWFDLDIVLLVGLLLLLRLTGGVEVLPFGGCRAAKEACLEDQERPPAQQWVKNLHLDDKWELSISEALTLDLNGMSSCRDKPYSTTHGSG